MTAQAIEKEDQAAGPKSKRERKDRNEAESKKGRDDYEGLPQSESESMHEAIKELGEDAETGWVEEVMEGNIPKGKVSTAILL